MDKDASPSPSSHQVNSYSDQWTPAIYMLHPDAFSHWKKDAQVLMASCKERFKGFEKWLKARRDEGIFRQSWDAGIVNCLLEDASKKEPAAACNCITNPTDTRAAEKILEEAILSYRKTEADLADRLENIFIRPPVTHNISKEVERIQTALTYTTQVSMARCNDRLTEAESWVERLDRFSFLFDLSRTATHAEGAVRDRSAHINKMMKETDRKIADLTSDCEKFQMWKEVFDKERPGNSPENVNLISWESQPNPYKDGVSVLNVKPDCTKALVKALQMVEADFLTHARVHIETLKRFKVTTQRCQEEIRKAKSYSDFFLSTTQRYKEDAHWHFLATDMNSFELKFIKGVVERWQDEDENYFEENSLIAIETRVLAAKKAILIQWIREKIRFLWSTVDKYEKEVQESHSDMISLQKRSAGLVEEGRKMILDRDNQADVEYVMNTLQEVNEQMSRYAGEATKRIDIFSEWKREDSQVQIAELFGQEYGVLNNFDKLPIQEMKTATTYAIYFVDQIHRFTIEQHQFKKLMIACEEQLEIAESMVSSFQRKQDTNTKMSEEKLKGNVSSKMSEALVTERATPMAMPANSSAPSAISITSATPISFASAPTAVNPKTGIKSNNVKKKKRSKNKQGNDRFKISQEASQVGGRNENGDTVEANFSEAPTSKDGDAVAVGCGNCEEIDGVKMVTSEEASRESTKQEGSKQISAPINSCLRTCALQDCVAMETTPKQFQICARCKKMKSRPANFYCGIECQTQDWNTKHKHFHVEESRLLKELKKNGKEVGDKIGIE